MHPKTLKQFFELESASSIVLLLMAALAMILANSPLAFIHQKFIEAFLFWINEGLMAVFFLLVGLELKRGYLEGQLSQLSQISLPLFAALGGMLIPIIIYLTINYDSPETRTGWAIPSATDIAFAIGVLSLFGNRVPIGLKLFLLALAIFDDIGAILLIAFFFSHHLSIALILLACIFTLFLYLLNRFSINALLPYLLVGIGLWMALLGSGIHPTISGVILALAIPGKTKQSPLLKLETMLHPWVAYLIMPLFALANAGFSLQGLSWQIFTDVIVVGIVLGLFVGKQIGVFGFAWLLIKTGYAKLPEKSSWPMLYGVSILCGIGFTMSLFLGTLSFPNKNIYLAEVRLGVITGSILSGLFGALVLFKAFATRKHLKE